MDSAPGKHRTAGMVSEAGLGAQRTAHDTNRIALVPHQCLPASDTTDLPGRMTLYMVYVRARAGRLALYTYTL